MISRNDFKKILKGFSVGVLALSVFSASALTISPARVEITGDKGETLNDSFLLINEQDTEQTYYTSVEAFDSQGESGTPNFTASKEGLPSWITVEEKITVKKGERLKIPYTITIPQDAESGGHFAAIFLSTVPPSTSEGQVSVGAKVGMLVLLKVTGDVKEEGGLLSFILKDEKKFLTSLPVDFVYRFSNKGNDRVKPEGEVVVKNLFGGEVAKLDANKALGNVLPGSVRRFEVRLGEKEAPAVSAPFFEHVSFQKENFALGMYTAHLDLSFGNSGKAESKVTYFVFPWQLMTVTIVGVLILLIVLVSLLKQYNKWIIKQARSHSK
jgi:hypothetical protein